MQLPKLASKEANALVKHAHKNGWTIKEQSRNNPHVQCLSPDRVTVVVVAKNCRAMRKIKSDFKKGGLSFG